MDYTILESQFGENVARSSGEWRKTAKTIVKQKNRRIFLLTCKSKNLTPSFLRIKNANIMFNCKNLERKYNENILNRFYHNSLNILITDTNLKSDIEKTIPQNTFIKISDDSTRK